jgi:hypothetical protein
MEAVSHKMHCPGCNSTTSGIAAAFNDGRSCPNCGLSAEAALEVESIRDRRGDEQLKADLAAAIIRADHAESLAVHVLIFARRSREELDRIIRAAERAATRERQKGEMS